MTGNLDAEGFKNKSKMPWAICRNARRFLIRVKLRNIWEFAHGLLRTIGLRAAGLFLFGWVWGRGAL